MVTYLSLARPAMDLCLPDGARAVAVHGYPFGAVAFDGEPDAGIIDRLVLLLVHEGEAGDLLSPGNGFTLRLVHRDGSPMRLAGEVTPC